MVKKTCNYCKESKYNRLFEYDPKTRDKRRPNCRDCEKIISSDHKPLPPLHERLKVDNPAYSNLFSSEVDTPEKLHDYFTKFDKTTTWKDTTLDQAIDYYMATQLNPEDYAVVKSNHKSTTGPPLPTFTTTPSWVNFWSQIRSSSDYTTLSEFITREREVYIPDLEIFPPPALMLHAFILTPLHRVKVVILGQDPYHGPKQAHGLSFSVPHTTKIPPSLKNIFRELNSDTGSVVPERGDLSTWAQQGVLLLNTALTVRQTCPNSHAKYWSSITNQLIDYLSKHVPQQVVFILWGGHAKSKRSFIDETRHHIIESNHPSPLSANRGGFFGTRPFTRCNALLQSIDQTPIDWETVK